MVGALAAQWSGSFHIVLGTTGKDLGAAEPQVSAKPERGQLLTADHAVDGVGMHPEPVGHLPQGHDLNIVGRLNSCSNKFSA